MKVAPEILPTVLGITGAVVGGLIASALFGPNLTTGDAGTDAIETACEEPPQPPRESTGTDWLLRVLLTPLAWVLGFKYGPARLLELGQVAPGDAREGRLDRQ